MPTLDIVVVAARSYTMDQECLDLFDPWERLDTAGSGRHLIEILVAPSCMERYASDGLARSVLWKIKLLGCRDK
jgi:hypothetical protein